jgi:hypothetical protein
LAQAAEKRHHNRQARGGTPGFFRILILDILDALYYYNIMNKVSDDTELVGKKIFFLHPSAVVQNKVAAELIQQEFEVYIIRQPHDKFRHILKRYPDSIVFADIDEGMSEKDWEAWIRGVQGDPEINRVAIGVLSANDDELLQRKYINSVQIQCGYTVLRSDLGVSINYILEILKAADAKGRRKYIRVTTENMTNTTVNFPINGTFVNGVIRDISVVGFSCTFDKDPELVKNTLFKDIQIKLQSQLLKAEGIVFGSRMDGSVKIYVILFTQRIDPEVRTKIRKYIQQNLQDKMDSELK